MPTSPLRQYRQKFQTGNNDSRLVKQDVSLYDFRLRRSAEALHSIFWRYDEPTLDENCIKSRSADSPGDRASNLHQRGIKSMPRVGYESVS
jgi:hypothetical protein